MQGPDSLPLALSYDDVLLVPRRSGVASRRIPSTAGRFSRRIGLATPIASANMDTVTEKAMAIAMAQVGGIGVIHRFVTVERQCEEVAAVVSTSPHDDIATTGRGGGLAVAAAVGTQGDSAERAKALVAAGADALVIDIAHGHSEQVIALLDSIRHDIDDDVDIVAGNVATGDGARDLVDAGADAVKVGVGPGSACTTRVVAGVGVPQLSAVMWCAEAIADSGIPVIADGGIRTSGDLAKALAAGAECAMVGNLLARADESPAELVERDGISYKLYRGMASHGAAATRPGGAANIPDAAEGVEGVVPSTGPVSDVIRQFSGGLRSSMSYTGAVTLPEFREHARFVRITPGGLRESLPHDLVQE